MNTQKINKLRKKINITLKKAAKLQLKINPKLKTCVLDIKQHFKCKVSWPLVYSYYQEKSGVDELIFNQVLLLLNMKIYFCNTRQQFVFKKVLK